MERRQRFIQDQAEHLRDQVANYATVKEESEYGKLPPRSEVHKNKLTKQKWKIKYPIVRLLVLFFILLPIIILTIYYYQNNQMTPVNTNINKNGVTPVEIENK